MSDSDDDIPGPSKRPERPPPPKRSPRKAAPAIQPHFPNETSPLRPTQKSQETQSERPRKRSLRFVAPTTIQDVNDLTSIDSTASLPLPEQMAAFGSARDRAIKILRRKDTKNTEQEEPEERVTIEDEPPRKSLHERRDMRVKATRILYTTDEEVRDALMEFGVFIIFLILTSLVTLSVRHSYMFFFNDTMKKLFTTRDMVIQPSVTVSFEKLITIPDFWDYMIYNFLVTLHGDMTIINSDGSHIDEDEVALANSTNVNATEDADIPLINLINKTHLEGRVFLHENLMLGPPRLRQVRVRKDSCFVNDAFIRYFNTCYADYSSGAEEIIHDHGGALFKTMGDLDAMPVWTHLSFYNTGGYTIDLTFDKKKNLETIKKLKKQHWVDRGTRICLIEFNMYNENTDTFQSAKFIAEIPPTGGIIPQSQLQTVKQFSFITDKSMTMCVVYIFWYIMVVYYNIYEISALRKCGCKNYFKSMLNILDALILILCYLALVYNIWHTFKVKSLINRAKFEESYISLDVLCFWNIIYVDMMAVLAFLVWIKIFKFISFNKTLVQFTTTLKRCSKDLAGFSLMFGIVFLAYAQLGLLLFGTKHPDFRNFTTSILTMIRMILGDFQYNLIEEANRVLGPIYFLTYILLVFFILLNMFLAIIMETYNSVKSEITQGRSQLGSYIYKKLATALNYILHCGRKRQNVVRFIKTKTEEEEDEYKRSSSTTYQQPKVNLRRNMTEAEAHYFEDVPPDVQNKDMFRLNNRVSLLEEILEQLVTNMDGILKRVENEIKKNR